MDVDAVGHQARAVPRYLAARTQIGDVGDAQTAQLVAAFVAQLAQFAGPEQPAGSQTPVVSATSRKFQAPCRSRTPVSHLR